MLARLPSMVVMMLSPEFSSFPFRLQVMCIGMSPLDTTQLSCAYAPESTTSSNEKGTILGGSKKK